jgi:acyl carrier protein
MRYDEAVALVINVISTSRSIDPGLLSPSTNLAEDLGFDSLDAAELLAAFHTKVGQKMAVDDISQLTTVDGVAKLLAVQEVTG